VRASISRADAVHFAQEGARLPMDDSAEPVKPTPDIAPPRSWWARVPRWAWVSASGPIAYVLFYVVWRLA